MNENENNERDDEQLGGEASEDESNSSSQVNADEESIADTESDADANHDTAQDAAQEDDENESQLEGPGPDTAELEATDAEASNSDDVGVDDASEDSASDEHVSEEVDSENLSSENLASEKIDSEGETAEDAGSEDDESDDAENAPREPVDIPDLPQIIEGAVLAADKPLSIDHIIQLFPDAEPTRAQVREAITEIQANCEGRGFELKEVASGFRFQVRQDYADWVGRLWDEKPPRYTRALLETLALIAYKQPITRGDIEDIRGVSVSTNIIRTLLEREWIRVVGHRDVPGRPSIYATTKTFLDYFNLTSLDELPTLSEIKDLDKVNEELDLDGELIEPRSLSLEETSEEVDATQADDEALDEVTDRVNAIQENIKNLFREPEESDDDFDDEDEDDLPSPEQQETEQQTSEDSAVDDSEVEADAIEAGTTESEDETSAVAEQETQSADDDSDSADDEPGSDDEADDEHEDSGEDDPQRPA